MVKIAFCDDDIAVVRQIAALLNKYRETRDQPMECMPLKARWSCWRPWSRGFVLTCCCWTNHAGGKRHQRRP